MKHHNILYLHCHDMGRYISPYGYAVDTPRLQQLAEEGVLFRNAFCAAPTCSPSRASLLTGQSPHSVGMLGLAHRGHSLNSYNAHIIHTLREHGYTSALSGVQHIVASNDKLDEIGYDVVHPYMNDEQTLKDACDFLKQPHKKPFFLSAGFFQTHRFGPPDERGSWWHNNEGSKPTGDSRYVRPPAPLPDTPQTREDFADYAAAATRLDKLYGTLLDALDAAGLRDNTIVICTTDHGIAFPKMKCNLTDHGIGVALIMRGPSDLGLTGGHVIDGMVSHVDVFPTICEMVGIGKPDRLEGTSFMPLLKGDAAEVNDSIFAEVTFHAHYEPKRAIRTKRWKYIKRFDDKQQPIIPPDNCDGGASKLELLESGWLQQPVASEYLYDLMFDPVESCNLADSAEHTKVKHTLDQQLHEWMQRTRDPLLKGSLRETSL